MTGSQTSSNSELTLQWGRWTCPRLIAAKCGQHNKRKMNKGRGTGWAHDQLFRELPRGCFSAALTWSNWHPPQSGPLTLSPTTVALFSSTLYVSFRATTIVIDFFVSLWICVPPAPDYKLHEIKDCFCFVYPGNPGPWQGVEPQTGTQNLFMEGRKLKRKERKQEGKEEGGKKRKTRIP